MDCNENAIWLYLSKRFLKIFMSMEFAVFSQAV